MTPVGARAFFGQAVRAWTFAVELHGPEHSMYHNMAFVELARLQHPLGTRSSSHSPHTILTKAIHTLPNADESYFLLGQGLQHAGGNNNALNIYERSVFLTPTNAEVYESLGVCHGKLFLY